MKHIINCFLIFIIGCAPLVSQKEANACDYTKLTLEQLLEVDIRENIKIES